jgi:F-type H+-transporting ATPase subunit gamma
MASLDDLKKRIASVKSTQKITKAMKMVAAAKLRRAQESAEKGRPYSEKMNNIILKSFKWSFRHRKCSKITIRIW